MFFVGSQGDIREEEEVGDNFVEDHDTYCLDPDWSFGAAGVYKVPEDDVTEIFDDQEGATAAGSSYNLRTYK